MSCAAFLAVGFALTLSQDTDEARRAIAIVKKHEGTITFDAKAPGKPVVGVNL